MSQSTAKGPDHVDGSARLLALDGAICPSCRESLARVSWRGRLALVSCGAGCPARRIMAAAGLSFSLLERV